MDLKDMGVDDIVKLAALATGLLSLATKLGFLLTDAISKSKDISDDRKAELIQKIKDAQASVPEW